MIKTFANRIPRPIQIIFLIEMDRRLNLFFDRIRRIQMFIEKQIKIKHSTPMGSYKQMEFLIIIQLSLSYHSIVYSVKQSKRHEVSPHGPV